MKKKVLSITTAFTLVFSFMFYFIGCNAQFTSKAFDKQGEAEAMLVLVNKERAKYNLKPLKLYPYACQKASIRAKEISTLFSHERPNGTKCFTVLGDIKYSKLAENIAMNYSRTVDEAMNQWMNSEGHRSNILNPDLTHIGVSMYKSGNAYYWVQIFLGYSGYSGEYTPIRNDGTAYSYGDIDGNKTVDASDASLALSAYSATSTGGKIPLNDKAKKAADVNTDNKVDASDASSILMYYALSSTGSYPYFNAK